MNDVQLLRRFGSRAVLAVLFALALAVPAAAQDAPQAEVRDLTEGELQVDDLVDALQLAEPPPEKTRGLGARKPFDCSRLLPAKTRGLGAVRRPSVAAIEVLFALDADELTEEARRNLDVLAQALATPALASCCILIEGHTDASGSEAHNQDLSQRRAERARHYLVDTHRIPAEQLLRVGYGESRPIADNASDDGRRKNRRVQIVNLGYVQAAESVD